VFCRVPVAVLELLFFNVPGYGRDQTSTYTEPECFYLYLTLAYIKLPPLCDCMCWCMRL
jgi:hypothetical protein